MTGGGTSPADTSQPLAGVGDGGNSTDAGSAGIDNDDIVAGIGNA
jgi:hypothetical protein